MGPDALLFLWELRHCRKEATGEQLHSFFSSSCLWSCNKEILLLHVLESLKGSINLFLKGTYWLNDCMVRWFCIVLCCKYPFDTLKVYFDFIIPHLIKCSRTTVFTHSLIVMPVCRHPSVGIMVQSQSGYTERMSEFNISSMNSIILSNWVRLSKIVNMIWFDWVAIVCTCCFLFPHVLVKTATHRVTNQNWDTSDGTPGSQRILALWTSNKD